MLSDIGERCFELTRRASSEMNMGAPDGSFCSEIAEGPWRSSSTIVLVAEVYSLTLLGPESPFGRFPTVRVDDDWGHADYEPSAASDYVESSSWYLDDSPSFDELPHLLISGHALIRFAAAIGCIFDSEEMIDHLGFFYPSRLGRWGLDAPLSASINGEIDNGPHSRLYQRLIREVARTEIITKTFLELYADFSSVFSWYTSYLQRANRRAQQIVDDSTNRILDICYRPQCSNDEELPF